MSRKKIIFIAASLTAIILGFYLLINYSRNRKPKSGKLTIITTLFPLYDFAKNIGGDKIDVTLLLPPGVEAHTFEPKPEDVMKINQADVFVYTGKFMEPWAESLIKGATSNSTVVVDASTGITLTKEGDQGTVDPHIWLDFSNAKKMVDTISQSMISKDTANASEYRKNTATYKDQLDKLDQSYQAGLKNCQSREIIYAGHYDFGYLAKKYNLTYSATQGPAPDSEPTPRDLIELARTIREKNIQTVFFEETSRGRNSQILQSETKTRLLPLNSAHNLSKSDLDKNVSFIDLMHRNLENLETGLRCSSE